MRSSGPSGGLQPASREKSGDEPIRFPRARLYLAAVGLLLLLSLFDLAVEWGQTAGAPPSLSLGVRISPITVTLFLLAWIPFLLPELRNWLRWLRGQGVEQVDLGPVKVILAKLGLDRAADRYQEEVLEPDAESSTEALAQNLDAAYRAAAALPAGSQVSAAEALALIDRLADDYDQVQANMLRGQARTRVMGNIAALMWTLMPFVRNFPAGERLTSPQGGMRLSAYKFLEWQPQAEHLGALVARAVGVEEEPFGQYNALLALRRLVAEQDLAPQQRQLIREQLEWYLTLPVTSRHRRKLMRTILVQLAPGSPAEPRAGAAAGS
jgi:hypothetical protein